MFIRKVKKNNGKTTKIYETLHLIESYRTSKGPRQKLILNLGNLNIDKSQYSALAKRIGDILTGQQSFDTINNNIEKFAKNASKKIFELRAISQNNKKETDFQNVDIASLELDEARSLGAEFICNSVWNELKLDNIFTKNGINENTLSIIKALVIGRLIEPNSERHTKTWAESRSALFELIRTPLQGSLNSYYRAGDVLLNLKGQVETHLRTKEKDLFSLEETTFFFDLTNTYFEGLSMSNGKALRGRSKEKRSDCKLVTLGLIIDSLGFAKYSKLYPGNQVESKTLLEMVTEMDDTFKHNITDKEIKKTKTIVIDAGIATKDNIEMLKNSNYHYIAVNRGNPPFEEDFSDMQVIREDVLLGVKLEVKRFKSDGETYILCRSRGKKLKESSIRSRFEALLLERLEYYQDGLGKPKRLKNYQKLLKNIGRLQEKYSKAAQLYEMNVIPEDVKDKPVSKLNAKQITWKKKDDLYTKKIEGEGVYVIRTSRNDLSDQEIWENYIMLTRLENAFRSLKSHLGLRPVFHQLEKRVDAHLFISVLAYHLLHIIETRLRKNGETRQWSTIRDIMHTHQRTTIAFNILDENGVEKRQKIRLNTNPDEEQKEIYKKLGISINKLPVRKIQILQV